MVQNIVVYFMIDEITRIALIKWFKTYIVVYFMIDEIGCVLNTKNDHHSLLS